VLNGVTLLLLVAGVANWPSHNAGGVDAQTASGAGEWTVVDEVDFVDGMDHRGKTDF
jgi:hypothetical protein